MTKGNDVKHLYSKLGLQPADYKEVRADEEVMHSIEERWPLLRDLLASLARSLDAEPGQAATVQSVAPAPHVAPQMPAQPVSAPAAPLVENEVPAAGDIAPTQTAVPSVQPPPVVESTPPAPAWLDQPAHADSAPAVESPSEMAPSLSAAPQVEEVNVAPVSTVPTAVEPPAESVGAESLADRLERLYGNSAVDESQPTTPAEPMSAPEPEPQPEPESVDSSDYGAAPVAHPLEQPDDDSAAPEASVDASRSGGLLSRLLSRQSEVKRAEPTIDEPSVSSIAAQPSEVEQSDSAGDSAGNWVMSEDDPPPIDLPIDNPVPQANEATASQEVETLGTAHASMPEIQPPPVVAPPPVEAAAQQASPVQAEAADPELNEIFQRLAPKSDDVKAVPTAAPEPQKRDLQSTFARLKRGV